MVDELVFEKKDPFDEDEVDVPVDVFVFSKPVGGFFREVGGQVYRAVLFDREDKFLEKIGK